MKNLNFNRISHCVVAITLLTSASPLLAQWTCVDSFPEHSQTFDSATLPDGRIVTTSDGVDADGNTIWRVRLGDASGNPWATIDEFQSQAGTYPTSARHVEVGPGGEVLVAGQRWAINQNTVFVRKGIFNGQQWEWETVEETDRRYGSSHIYDLASDGQGRFAWVGSSGKHIWFVRLSNDGGHTWETVDAIDDSSFGSAYCADFDSAGRLHVLGNRYVLQEVPSGKGKKTTTIKRVQWVIRTLTLDGIWTQDFVYEPAQGASLSRGPLSLRLLVTSDDRLVFAATEIEDTSLPFADWVIDWIVLSSIDQGHTWEFKDRFGGTNLIGQHRAWFRGLHEDQFGRIYVSGASKNVDTGVATLRITNPTLDNWITEHIEGYGGCFTVTENAEGLFATLYASSSGNAACSVVFTPW